MSDVFKMLKDLELKAVGLDEKTNKMQEGYFVSFRSIGLPIHPADYENPWSPLGVNLEKNIPKTDPVDPKDAPKTGSANVDTTQAFAANIAQSQQAYLNTYVLVNNKIKMNHDYVAMKTASNVADSWYAIITGSYLKINRSNGLNFVKIAAWNSQISSGADWSRSFWSRFRRKILVVASLVTRVKC